MKTTTCSVRLMIGSISKICSASCGSSVCQISPRAIPLYEQGLADCVRVLGDDHPHTMTLRANLATAYQAAGDLGRAIPLHEQTLADRQRILGDDHPRTLARLSKLASAHHDAVALRR